ncbi:MAG: TolC family protein [Verrucomicrobiota bacterium]
MNAAQENNPGVQAAYNRWQAALRKAEVVKTLPDPRLTYRYFIESVETRVGPQEHKAGISQQFPWPGKLDARQKAQLARADSTYEQYRAARLKLAYDLRRAYSRAWLLHRETELMKQNIQLLKNIEGVAESRVRAGASAAEVIKAQLERAQLEERLQTFDEKRIPINAELNAALNRDSTSPLPTISQLDFRSIDPAFVPSIQTNPDLMALVHELSGSESGIREAKKEGWPNLTLGVEWIGIGDASAPVSDSGKDAWMAGIGVSLPLWRGKHNADIERAAFMRNTFDFARQQKANVLKTKLEAAAADYREAERKIALYRDTILPQAGQLLKLSETDYRSGKASFLDLIDTQRSILRYQLELARARADSQIHLAKIEMLTGKELNHEK